MNHVSGQACYAYTEGLTNISENQNSMRRILTLTIMEACVEKVQY